MVYPLVKHPERSHGMSWDVLACLCEYLDCQPGDLLGYASLKDSWSEVTAHGTAASRKAGVTPYPAGDDAWLVPDTMA